MTQCEGTYEAVSCFSILRFSISASSFVRSCLVRTTIIGSISYFGHFKVLSKHGRCKVISVFGDERAAVASAAPRMGTRGQLD